MKARNILKFNLFSLLKLYSQSKDITQKILNLNKFEDTINLINKKMKYGMRNDDTETESSKM